jgi:hypothetical protein
LKRTVREMALQFSDGIPQLQRYPPGDSRTAPWVGRSLSGSCQVAAVSCRDTKRTSVLITYATH